MDHTGTSLLKPSSFTDSNIKTWLNTPENMASLWSLGKNMLNDLPAPRSVNELEDTFTTLNKVLKKKVDTIKAGCSTPLIGRGLLKLCSDWWVLDVADTSSLMP